jgi:hypothetical protein
LSKLFNSGKRKKSHGWRSVECGTCLSIGIVFQLKLLCVLAHGLGAKANCTVSIHSLHSLTIYRTSNSTSLKWILSISDVWMHLILIWVQYNFSLIQGDSGGKMNILAGDSIGHC